LRGEEGEKLPASWDTRRSEVRGQRSEGGGQKTEVRSQGSEGGGRGGQKLRGEEGEKSRRGETIFLAKSSEEFKTRGYESGLLPGSLCLGISAGNDRGGEWYSRLPACESGKEYVFTGYFFRDRWKNGVYPSISLWGKRFYLNTHLLTKTFQPIQVHVTCPDKVNDPNFRFINDSRGETFWLGRPYLTKNHSFETESGAKQKPRSFYENSFPIGVYGASLENLTQIKQLAINTVLIGGSGKKLKTLIEGCHKVGLRYVVSVPRDPDRLPVFLNEIASYVRPYDLAFYVNDEPGIYSFPINKANDINRLIKDKFPESATCMAVVRPQVCRDYADTADFFMMDQYPVPYMPMTWLSDSMDEAEKGIEKGRKEEVNGYLLLVSGLAPQYDLPDLRGKQRGPSTICRPRPGLFTGSYPSTICRPRPGLFTGSYGAGPSEIGSSKFHRAGGAGKRAKAREARIRNQQITNNVAPVPSSGATGQAKGRLASVIQAFGGKRYANVGWPRLPTWREMDCLAFLSVVHGSRGIFFFTFSAMGKTGEGRQRLGRVVGRLNRIYPWLVEKNLDQPVKVEMISEYRFDPKGRPSVHCCLKKKGDELLLIAVNTIGTYVEARLILEGEKVRRLEGEEGRRGEQQKIRREEGVKRRKAQEVFSGEDYVVVDEKIRVRFGPYEVKAFLIRDRN
jgi:hypothetical protein